MKRNLKNTALAIGLMALGMVGCQKDTLNQNFTDSENLDYQIQSLVTQTDNESDVLEVYLDDNTSEIAVQNEGIPTDYLVTSEDLSETSGAIGGNTDNRKHIKDNSFLRCLKGLGLDSDQYRKLAIILAEFKDCNASAIKRARTIHAELQKKYKELAEAQIKLYKNNEITKSELEARLKRIRMAFHKELRDLHLKEKLADAFKNCHDKMLRQLHGILTDRQWAAFVKCYKR
ncbi:MAG: hypothetical protein HUU47_06800 [Bacteroidetes bacterium]|nr:hypothetical protein [Bacteroidota bacterium]